MDILNVYYFAQQLADLTDLSQRHHFAIRYRGDIGAQFNDYLTCTNEKRLFVEVVLHGTMISRDRAGYVRLDTRSANIQFNKHEEFALFDMCYRTDVIGTWYGRCFVTWPMSLDKLAEAAIFTRLHADWLHNRKSLVPR